MSDPVNDADLHAYIDGELSPQQAAAVEAAMARDPILAARIHNFEADKRAVAAAYAPLANVPVPASLLAAAFAGSPRPAARPKLRRVTLALTTAAALAAGIVLTLTWRAPRDPAVEQALAARYMTTTPARELVGQEPTSIQVVDQAMSVMLGMPTRVPDLQRAGFKLVSAEIYGQTRTDAVQLRYEDGARRLFTVFLRPSAGPDAFDIVERGQVRICVWQNADLTAVMTGDMPTPELFRLASLTYSSLNL
jgi:anti-sigma factor RsiW